MSDPVINIYNQDCMEAMKEMKDNQYDLAIVDPPYGIFIDDKKMSYLKGMANDIKKEAAEWDIKPKKEYFVELLRVSKDQIIWGGNYFLDNLSQTKCFLIWDKLNPGLPFADAELAWTSLNRTTKIFRYPHLGYGKSKAIKEDGKSIHPTQKPTALYKWILTNYAKKGQRILDTHGGSMSIAIACWDFGFDLDLYELDKGYFEAGKRRLEEHKKQLFLFRQG